MNILYVIDTLKRGGKERRLTELINTLPQNYRVSIILLRDEIEYDINNKNIKIFICEANNKISKLIWFYKKIALLKPDIVHSWYCECSQFSLPACKTHKIKFITSEITNVSPISIKRISKYQIIKSIIFRASNHITSNSQAGLDIYKAPATKSSVIHNGFNFQRAILQDFSNPLNGHTGKLIVLMIANFTEKKDYRTFITAAVDLLEKRNDLVFVAIGKGSRLNEIIQSVPRRYASSFIFPGFVSNVEEYIANSDIGVLTSYGEGFPNSVMEFMAFKKPVIATMGGGTSELIVDNRNGILIPQKSPNDLIVALEYLINNEKIRLDYGVNAYHHLKSEFSLEKMTNKFVELYDSIV